MVKNISSKELIYQTPKVEMNLCSIAIPKTLKVNLLRIVTEERIPIRSNSTNVILLFNHVLGDIRHMFQFYFILTY